MSEEIIEQVSNDVDFYKEIKEEFDNFNTLSVMNKSAVAPKIFLKYKQLEKAMEIAGDTIYNEINKNEVLQEKLEKIGEYNEDEINKLCIFKKTNTTNQDKNNKIRKALQQTIIRSKMITDK